MPPEEKKPSVSWDAVEIGFVLLMAFLIIQAVLLLPARMREAPYNSVLGKWGSFIGINESLGEGVAVKNEIDAFVYRDPAGEVLAVVRKGTLGTIIETPLTIGGETWWLVRYETEEEGWVRKAEIKRLTEGGLRGFGKALWYLIKFVGTFLSLLFLIGIVYVTLRFNELTRKEKALASEAVKVPGVPAKGENEKWLRVLEHIESTNPNDWRLAILEADVMLDDMLEIMGYRAPTLAEKLKMIEPSDFTNLDKAWEAHKIRNLIAHEGADFQISQREARRIIYLYRDVFTEFRYI